MYTQQRLPTILAQSPRGLAFDIDGTLSPIASTPDEARIYPGVLPLLAQAQKYAHVAILTGRSIDDGASMVNLDGLTYIGTHGLEWSEGLPWLHSVEITSEALNYYEPGKYLLDLVEQYLEELPGELIVEIRVPLPVHKGRAIRQFAQRYNLKAIVFAGDDRTDLDAVTEITSMRKEGIAALSIVVQHHDTLPELLAQADIVVQEVLGMVELLREIVTILENNQ